VSIGRPPQSIPAGALAPKVRLVCDVLVQDGLLKPEQLEAVYTQANKSGGRVEEVLLELGLIAEADLLKALAARYKAFFITSEKLAKADLARAVMDMLPMKFADKLGVCPLMFDANTHVLSVITADPDNLENLR